MLRWPLETAACGEDDGDIAGPGEAPNRAPVAVGETPSQTIFFGETVTVDVSAAFTDPDGDALTFEAVSSDTDVVVVATSGSEVTLEGAGRGVTTVTVTARDAEGGEASQSFGVEVANRTPLAVGEIPPRTMFLGETVTVDVSAAFTDPDGDALTFEAVSSDTDVVVVATSGSEVTLEGAGRGVTTVTVTARDAEGGEASQSFGVEVANRTPLAVGEIPPRTMFLGETVTVDVSAAFTDPDGDALTFEAVSSDTAVVVVATSGSEVVVSGVQEGTATVTVRAADSAGLSVARDFDVTVGTRGSTNQPPVVTRAIPAQTVRKNESVSMDLDGYFSDPEGGALVYGASSSNDDVAAAADMTPRSWTPHHCDV
ncbi:Ig-like domain-containing protein [Candidatus Palauibacter sp.]|uniref:Ig-like domain-containing protein n=1 Tax=Candidatus Palauibacter sp. TaxID=3101350 RepID=UPI003CC5837F